MYYSVHGITHPSGWRAALELTDPVWGLSDQPRRPVVTEMSEIIENIIELGEEILAGLFYKLKHNSPLMIQGTDHIHVIIHAKAGVQRSELVSD